MRIQQLRAIVLGIKIDFGREMLKPQNSLQYCGVKGIKSVQNRIVFQNYHVFKNDSSKINSSLSCPK